jgi:hypothetical protein
VPVPIEPVACVPDGDDQLDDGSSQKATPDDEIQADMSARGDAFVVDGKSEEFGAIPGEG